MFQKTERQERRHCVYKENAMRKYSIWVRIPFKHVPGAHTGTHDIHIRSHLHVYECWMCALLLKKQLLKSYSNYYFVTQIFIYCSFIRSEAPVKLVPIVKAHTDILCSISLCLYSMNQSPRSNTVYSLQFYALRWKSKPRKLNSKQIACQKNNSVFLFLCGKWIFLIKLYLTNLNKSKSKDFL